MNNRAQVEALLDSSIMLGIGYFSSALDDDEREQLYTRLLLCTPVRCAPSRRALMRSRIREEVRARIEAATL
jgi:hypothetical protein